MYYKKSIHNIILTVCLLHMVDENIIYSCLNTWLAANSRSIAVFDSVIPVLFSYTCMFFLFFLMEHIYTFYTMLLMHLFSFQF